MNLGHQLSQKDFAKDLLDQGLLGSWLILATLSPLTLNLTFRVDWSEPLPSLHDQVRIDSETLLVISIVPLPLQLFQKVKLVRDLGKLVACIDKLISDAELSVDVLSLPWRR